MGLKSGKLATAQDDALFRQMAETASQGLVFCDLEGIIRYSNPAHHRMHGYSPPELIGRHLDFVFKTDEQKAEFRDYFAWLVDNCPEPTPYEAVNYRADGTAFDVRVSWNWSRDKHGDVCGIVSVVSDVTQYRHAERALSDSARRLRAAERLARLGHFEWDMRDDTSAWSEGLVGIFGYEPPKDSRNTYDVFMQLLHPDDRDRIARAIVEAVDTRNGLRTEYRIIRPDGELVHVQVCADVVCDGEGVPVRLIGVVQDMSMLYEARSQKLRVRELDHRVKNNLAQVLGLLQMTAASSRDLDEFIERFKGRIHSMAELHDALAQRTWKSVCVRDVVRGSLGADAARVEQTGMQVFLTAETAMPLGLAIHELGTNAIKHGALSASAGRVQLDWKLIDEHTLRLDWTELGGPEPAPEPPCGVGLTLVKALIEMEIGGRIGFGFERAGVHHVIELPRHAAC